MLPVLFAMSWAGMLIILVGIWLLVVVVRGLVDFAWWVYDVLFDEPRQRKRREDQRQHHRKGVARDTERV